MYPSSFNQRLVAGTASTLSWSQVGADGELVDPGVVTVGVTRADGTVAVASGNATAGAGTVARTYALTAAVTYLVDRLTVTWTAGGLVLGRTEVDVVAAPWWSNIELRAVEVGLADTATYTPAKITIARLQVEAFFERITHRRFVPGYEFEWVKASNDCDLVLSNPDVRKVRSVGFYTGTSATADSTLTQLQLDAIRPAEDGVIQHPGGTWAGTWVAIGYEWGLIAPPPDVRRQSMRLCKEILNETKSQIPDSAVTWNSQDLGWSAVLLTPGVRGAHTRLPSVNECLDGHTFTTQALA